MRRFLKGIKHGFNGFTRITRIFSRVHLKLTQHVLQVLSLERIRVNLRKSAKSAFNCP
ncbi:MAG: hypothetical protein FWG87_10305 [Defluviitaleaceae bacterium]|nr:hypothetical protein [Defluviitaleaceae bacterium]